MTNDSARLSKAERMLVATIYHPPRARRPWPLQDVQPAGTVRRYSLARWALADAFRAFGVGRQDCVLLPALICREMMASVHAVGATPVFYPVTRQLCPDISSRGFARVKAVVAVNYFGFPQTLEDVCQYCRDSGAALIEDNAHGLFSRDDDGRWLGGRADAGIFSFRKTIPVPNGAALVLTTGRALPDGSSVRSERAAGVRYRMKQAARQLAGHVDPVRTHQAIAAIRLMRQLATGAPVPSAADDAETRIPIPADAPAALAASITVAEPELEFQRRRALYDLAARVLARTGAVPVFPSLPPRVVPYGFPIFVAPEEEPHVAAAAAQHGFQLAGWPDLPMAVRPTAPDYYRRLMVLPFLW